MTARAWDVLNDTPGGQRWWPNEELVRALGRRRAALGWDAYGKGRVLEVGCGNGANLWFLAEGAYTEVRGLDISPTALGLARKYLDQRGVGERVTLDEGDLGTRLPYYDAAFDIVVDVMASQHLPWKAHPAVFQEYRRVLTPGGWLFVFHLDSETTHGEQAVPLQDYDYEEVGLFGAGPLFCLPPRVLLQDRLVAAGFHMPNVAGLQRVYDSGAVASYAVIDAEAS